MISPTNRLVIDKDIDIFINHTTAKITENENVNG
jgi:hypothetical protein